MNASTRLPIDPEGRITNPARVTESVARVLRALGLLNPYGDSDKKTALYGTYRQAGRDCPPSCRFNRPRIKRDGSLAKTLACYADNGNARFASQRAVASAVAAGNAFRMALYLSRRGEPVRLQVAGDLGQTWSDAEPVVAEYCLAAAAAGGSATNIVAYTYTALPRDEQGLAAAARLRQAGIMLRWSNRSDVTANATDTWGSRAVALDVRAFRQAARERTAEKGVRHVACPAQTQEGMTCRDCTLCWTRPDTVILFAEHD